MANGEDFGDHPVEGLPASYRRPGRSNARQEARIQARRGRPFMLRSCARVHGRAERTSAWLDVRRQSSPSRVSAYAVTGRSTGQHLDRSPACRRAAGRVAASARVPQLHGTCIDGSPEARSSCERGSDATGGSVRRETGRRSTCECKIRAGHFSEDDRIGGGFRGTTRRRRVKSVLPQEGSLRARRTKSRCDRRNGQSTAEAPSAVR
jgi:hypothetical protein